MKFVNAHGVEYVPHNWLTYDDITLMPRYSNIPSRNDPSIDLTTTIGGGATLATPIISANMDTVTEADMAIAIGKMGGLGILHRFYRSEDAWWSDILRVKDAFNAVAFSIGSAPDDADLVGKVLGVTQNVMVAIDVAHGDSQATALQVKRVATNYPHAIIIAGNVCTPDGAQLLIENGASAIKCGIGPGHACFLGDTPVMTDNGLVPISEISEGTLVLTHTGEYRPVNFVWEFSDRNVLLEIEIDGEIVVCTPDHKFYCVPIEAVDVVTEQNIHEYAKWLPANEIQIDKWLVVSM